MEPSRPHTLTRPHPSGGFTLVELLVSISILMIITAVVITGQSQFNKSILANDTAYTIALSAREAQTLGLSSRRFSGTQNAGYGVHFTNANPNLSYIVFADIHSTPLAQPLLCPILSTTVGTPEAKAGNCLFDDVGETYQTYTLTRGFTISDICGKNGSGALKCTSTNDFQSLDIAYLRPNTTAVITGIGSSGAQTPFTCAQISVKSPTDNSVQTIRMTTLGEVSVGQTCP